MDEGLVQGFTGLCIDSAQDSRRMKRHDQMGRPTGPQHLATHFGETKALSQQTPGCRRSEADYNVRRDRCDLGLQPGPTGCDVGGTRRLMLPAFSLHDKSKMF